MDLPGQRLDIERDQIADQGQVDEHQRVLTEVETGIGRWDEGQAGQDRRDP